MEALSKETINYLSYSTYRYKQKGKKIIFKKAYDYVGPLILLFLFALLALPIFSYDYWLGAITFTFIVVGIYFHRNLSIKIQKLIIIPSESKIELHSKEKIRWFSFDHVKGIVLTSNFKSEYSSAFKQTSEEYRVMLGLEFNWGEIIEIFYFNTDYAEPGKEIMELHDYLKSHLKKE